MIRLLFKVLAVVAIGAGVGVLTWGIVAAALGEPIRSPLDVFNVGFALEQPGEAIGWGAGLLAGGIVALVFGCSSGKKKGKFGD